MEIPYEKVIPESLIGEINDFSKRIIRKPCCTACYTSDIEEVNKEMELYKKLEDLASQAKALGFNNVDLYIPDKKNDEVVAFTFSKSEKYIQKIQDMEICG